MKIFSYLASDLFKKRNSTIPFVKDLNAILSEIAGQETLIPLTADVSNANATPNTLLAVPALSFPVSAGKTYRFRFFVHYTAAATTTGARWVIDGPTAPTRLVYRSQYSLTATSETINSGLGAYNLPAASNASSASTGTNSAIIEGYIQPSVDGTVTLSFASEVTASAIVAKAGSFLIVSEVK
jgi:hypothetical protein